MARGHESNLPAGFCAYPKCGVEFIPAQRSQKFCTPGHRFDASRLRTAIPIAIEHLQSILAEMEEPIALPRGQG